MRSNRVIPLDTVSQEELDLRTNRERESNVKILEYMAANGMFARYLSRGFKALNVGISRLVFFPLILFFQTIDLGLAINQARLEYKIQGRIKTGTLIKVATEFLTFGATAAAVIGGIIAPALFIGLLTPALLVAGVGLKAFVDFGNAAFLFARSFATPNTPLEKAERAADRYNAGRKLLSGLVNSAITVALALLAFTPAVPLVASLFLGIGGTVTGVALAAMTKARRSQTNVAVVQESDAQALVEEGQAASLSSTARLHSRLDVVYGLKQPAANPTVVNINTPAAASTIPVTSARITTFSIPESPLQQAQQPLVESSSNSLRA